MANTVLQVKRSAATAIPASLANGELAYSGNSTSNSLFIGHPDGSTGVIRIAGGKYPYVHQSTPGTLTTNAAVITDTNAFISNVFTTGLFIATSVASPTANSTAALITSISPSATVSQLGALATGSNTELVTSYAIKTYVDGKVAAGYVNTAAQFSWTNTHIFNSNVTIIGNTSSVLNIGNTAASNLSANATTLLFNANTTANGSINATSYTGTSNNATNLNGQAASFYTNATNITTGTLPWAQAPSGTVNTSGAFTITGVHTHNANVNIAGNTTSVLNIGSTVASNVSANATTILFNANTTANASINATSYTGTASNATNLNSQPASFYTNATNITTGTLPWAQAPSGTVNTSGTFTITGVHTHNANVALSGNSTGQLLVGATAANLIANGTNILLSANAASSIAAYGTNTTIVLGNSTVFMTANATGISGSANNSTNLNGQAASYYTNATNITTGTLPWAQAPSGTVNTSGAFTITGVYTHNANVNIAGNTTSVLNIGTTAASNLSANATTLLFNANTTANGSINATPFSGTSANATNLNSQPGSFYTNATNITTGTLPWAQAPSGTVNTSGAFTITGVHTHNANVALSGNSTGQLLVGATGANLIANATNILLSANAASSIAVYGANTTLVLGNSTVFMTANATGISGSANNSTNLNGQAASYYTNATNITTGTLPYAQLPANVVIWSNTNTFSVTQTFNANVTVVGNTLGVLAIGTSTANVVANSVAIKLSANSTDSLTINTTSILTGNATVYSTISQTLVNTSAIAVGGQVTVNSTVASFGTVANISAPSANLTVSSINAGNLNVTGTLSTIDTQTLQVKDNFIMVADGNGGVPTDIVDFGFYGIANTASVATYYGLGRVASGNYWTLFSTTTNPGATTLTGTSTSTLQAFLQPWGAGGAFVVNSTAMSFTANSSVSLSLTSNTLSLTTALPTTSGGTGYGSYTAGDILYASNTTFLSKLARGTDGQILQMQGTTVAWAALDGGTF